MFPTIAEEYSNENPIPADKIVAGSAKRVKWICSKQECGHVWHTSVRNRTNHNSGCPACAGQVATTKNNMATLRPDLAKEFMLDKNFPLTPETLLPSTNRNLWWQCSVGHVYKTTGGNRVAGKCCKQCYLIFVKKGNLTLRRKKIKI